MVRPLPTPITAGDEYLAAIHAELVQLNATLTALTAAPAPDSGTDGEMELREPQKPRTRDEARAQQTAIPDDFPGRAALLEEGITTLAAVPRSMAQLTAIPGIGPKTGVDIQKALQRYGI